MTRPDSGEEDPHCQSYLDELPDEPVLDTLTAMGPEETRRHLR